MKKNGLLLHVLLLLFMLVSSLHAQEADLTDRSLVAQKMLVEENYRRKIGNTLKEVLAIEKFIVDVDVDIEFTPVIRRETVYQSKDAEALAAEEEAKRRQQQQQQEPSSELDAILPGFPPVPEEGETGQEQTIAQTGETLQEKPNGVVSHSLAQTTQRLPEVKSVNVVVILEDGVSSAIMEQVRRVVTAAHIKPERGDLLTIHTAIFQPTESDMEKQQKLIKEIQEQRAEEKQLEEERIEALTNRMYWLMGILFVLAAVTFYLLFRKAPVQEGLMPRPQQPTSQEINAAKAAQRAQDAKNAQQEQSLKATRQAAVTFTVGKPKVATNIIKDWLKEDK